MNGKRRSGSSTQTNAVSKPKLGTKLPIQGRAKLVRLTETGLVLVFFVVICLLKIYYYAYSRTEQLRCRVMLILPTRNDRKKSGG